MDWRKRLGIARRTLACIATAGALASGALLPVTAYAATEEPEIGEISVTVPTEIPCTLMADGTVVVPGGLSIENSGGAIVVDAFTADDMGNAVDFTLDLDDVRALSRTGGKDTAPQKGIDMDAGSEKAMALKVSKLTRQSNAALMDAAADGGASMFKLGFRFSEKALQGGVAITGDALVGSTLTATVTGAQEDAKLAYQWYREGESPSGVIFDSDVSGSAKFSLKKEGWVTVMAYPTGHGDDSSKVTIRDASGDVVYSETVNPLMGLSGGLSLPVGDYTFEYVHRGTLDMRCQVTTDATALRGPMVPIPGATGNTYIATDADAGKKVICKVTDSSGRYTGTLTSDSVQIEKPREALMGNIYLLNRNGMNASAAHFGDQVSVMLIDGVQTDAVPYYHWYIDDVEVASGTETYVPQYDDIGHALRLKISDSSGKYSGMVESYVMQVDDEFYINSGLFRFSIPAQISVGDTISIGVEDLTGKYGDAVFEYKWYKVRSSGYGDLLKGETGASYKPTEAGTIRVSIRANFRGLVSSWTQFDIIVDGNRQLDPYVVPKGDSDE